MELLPYVVVAGVVAGVVVVVDGVVVVVGVLCWIVCVSVCVKMEESMRDCLFLNEDSTTHSKHSYSHTHRSFTKIALFLFFRTQTFIQTTQTIPLTHASHSLISIIIIFNIYM